MTKLELDSLEAPYDATAASALARRLRAAGSTDRTLRGVGVFIDAAGVLAGGIGLLVTLPLAILLLVQLLTGGDTALLGAFLLLLLFAAASAWFLWWTLHRYLPRKDRVETWWRLDRLAAANGLTFAPWSPAPDYPSELFHSGVDVAAYDHLRSATGEYFDLGNLYYQTGGQGSETFDHRWGFVAIQLDRSLPQILLDATGNQTAGVSGLPSSFDRSQVLSLEGDFDRFFTLYCPKGYERDALYLFTPDLMALLIDEVGGFDVEINGPWMFVFSRGPFDMIDPALLARLFRIIDIVGTKARWQSRHYVDANASIDANAGARPHPQPVLRRTTRIPPIVVAGGVMWALVGLGFAFITFGQWVAAN